MAGEIFRKEIAMAAPAYQVPRKKTSDIPYVGNQTRYMAMATFDVSALDSAGAANSAIGTHGLGVYIPSKAIVTGVWYDVITTVADGASDAATLAITVQSAGDAVAALAISDASNIWDAGIHGTKIPNYALDGNALTQIGMAAAVSATYVKATAEREITVPVAVHLLTAGKFNIFVEYVLSA